MNSNVIGNDKFLSHQPYASHGESTLADWVWTLTPSGRKLLAAPLERFLANSDWSLGA